MPRPRLQEGDPRFEERRNRSKEKIVRILREIEAAKILLSTLEKQLSEELEAVA